jgi:hypothetical protein
LKIEIELWHCGPEWLGSLIFHSINFLARTDSISLMCHTVLLLLTFIAFRGLDTNIGDGRSKRVIKFDEFDRSNF